MLGQRSIRYGTKVVLERRSMRDEGRVRTKVVLERRSKREAGRYGTKVVLERNRKRQITSKSLIHRSENFVPDGRNTINVCS